MRIKGRSVVARCAVFGAVCFFLASPVRGKPPAGGRPDDFVRVATCWAGESLLGSLISRYGKWGGKKPAIPGLSDNAQVSELLADHSIEAGVHVGRWGVPDYRRFAKSSFKTVKMLKPYPLGCFVVYVVVNAKNPVAQLTLDELAGIYRGKVKDWGNVPGGNKGNPIHIFSPLFNKTGYHVFKSRALQGYEPDKRLRDWSARTVRMKAHPDGVIGAVIQDVNAIGFFLFDHRNEVDKRVRVLGLVPRRAKKPVLPSKETIFERKYPLYQMMTMYAHPEAPAVALDFCKFAASPENARLLRKYSLFPECDRLAYFAKKRLAEDERDPKKWLGEQPPTQPATKPAPKAPTPSKPTGGASAVQQAKLQLHRAQELQARYRKLELEAIGRYRAQGLSDYSDEDRKQLDELRTAIERCFERAAQLDPTNEKSSRKLADAAWQKMSGQYGSMVQALERHTQYLDSFSGSPHARGMMERVIGLNVNLAVHLKRSGVRNSSIAAVPRNLPNKKLIKGYRRSAMKHLARYMVRFIPVRDRRGGGSFYSFGVMTGIYDGSMRAYFKLGVSEQEMEEVVAEYGRAVDRYPKLLKHSDFHRLRYFAMKQQKQAYVKLLTAMQKRWPDPKDVHWKLGKEEAVEDLCNMFETDRRASSFYQWLRGKRGVGDLPYVGYDPNKKGPKGEGGT